MKKIFSVVLALVLMVGILAACGNQPDMKAVVATVNGQDITADFYNFYLTQMKKQIEAKMDSSDIENLWEEAELEGKKLIDTAREQALDQVVSAVVVEQKAAEMGIKLSADEEKAVDSQISDTVAKNGSKANYEKWLEEQGLTEDIFKRFIRINYLSSKLNNEYSKNIAEQDLVEYYNKHIARVKHILIMTVDENQQPLSAAEVAEKKAFADELLGRARSGENFDDLVAQYSEDPGSHSQPDGYYLGEGYILGSQGSMVPEFEAMSLALEVGGISEPVETSFGYHIIKRYENAPEVFEQYKDTVKSYAMVERFADALDAWKTSSVVEVKNDIINKIQ